MPVDSLQVNMTINYFWCGYESAITFEDNVSSIVFSLTFKNPTNRDTPPLRIENYDFYINDIKLKPSTYDVFFGGSFRGLRYLDTLPAIKAHQTFTYSDVQIILMQKYTEAEGDDMQSVWAALTQGNFNVTLTGILVARTNFGNYEQPPSKIIMAARPLALSCTYQ